MTHKLVTTAAFKAAANQTEYLFKDQWKENTTALLHSPHSVDKMPLVLDIAENLMAHGKETVYVNTAHNLDAHADRLASIADLLIFTPSYDSPDDPTDYADMVIAGIEEIIAATSVRTFIIDSVSRIAGLSFGRNASATYVMKRLVALQVRFGLSLLVLSNDSTKSADRALINLADSEITLSSDQSDDTSATDCKKITKEEDVAKPVSKFKTAACHDPSARPLSRSERRELERRQRKLARKH